MPRDIALIALLAGSLPAQDPEAHATTLDKAIVAELDELLRTAKPAVDEGRSLELWRAGAIRHGELGLLIRELESRSRKATARPDELRLIRLSARYLRRLGDLSRALRMLNRIEEKEETIQDALNKAEVLDALGKEKDAIATYDRLLEKPLTLDKRSRILLRKALMTKISGKAGSPARRAVGPPARSAARSVARQPARPGAEPGKKPADKRSALARFAGAPGRAPELVNQAAVILALTGEQKEAIKLFRPEGEGTVRFRQEVRLAEWAIEAEEWAKAQDFAWNAVKSARLRRDRRYALTILVEAYRREAKLDALIARFAAAGDLDVESRETWIDLLRETGKVDEALRLFRECAGGAFSTDMRRELLEICREADQDQVLEKAYRRMISEEPRFLEWREGLARFYLERGRREDALAVWRPYLEVTGDTGYRMAAAASLMGLGLDDLAVSFARACMKEGERSTTETALLFLYELYRDRGRHEEARKVLMELDRFADAGADVRKEVAEAYARLGDKRMAVGVLEGLFEARGSATSPDTRMKLALMLSEVGEEEKALEHWHSLWRQIESIPRRRYVEERMMSVASRLGTLAKLAVDLEKKLVAGSADDRDAGLLVRLYIKVNDPVSATEVIEEHMKRSGRKPVDVLTEKARVFQSCNDFYNYEQVVKELIEIDPESRPDYLRQLAMSHMERGQRKEARRILERLKEEETDSVSDEFEAGVLALAGMREEALRSYRRGIAKFPERIDTYLLLSNMQKALGRHDRSAGMFQFLAESAEKDDLFTIAVDGILNMRDGRGNRGAPDRIVAWMRRVVLERIARRPDKLYLYRLVADLSEELKDQAMAIRALKAALPIAGEQRTQILRELMAMAKKLGGGGRSSGVVWRILPSGVAVPSRGSVARPRNADQLMFGRRILGQGDIVPPGVYLELGEAFLAAGEVQNATKTFNQASQLPEFAEMRRKIAQSFEVAGYPEEALGVYEQILSVENGDAALITKVGELHEQTGRDPVALELYGRGLELLLNRSVFAKTGIKKKEKTEEKPASPYVYMLRNRNQDEWDRQSSWLISGLLATLSEETAGNFLKGQRSRILADIERIETERGEGKLRQDGELAHHPRLARRATVYRRIAVAFDAIQAADEVDTRLVSLFPKDESLLEQLVRFRLSWGYLASARKLALDSSRSEKERKKLRLMAGGEGGPLTVPGVISVAEASGLLLPLLIEGKQDTAKALLERLDLSTGDKDSLEHMSMLVGCAVYLGDPDLTLTLCRHWLNLSVRHSPGQIYGAVNSILKQGRIALDKSQLRSLTEHLLNKVVESPDKFVAFIRRLPELRKTAGADFLTREQIEKVITSKLEGSDRFVYGLEDLFVLLDPEDRGPVLRAVWKKMPKTQTAYFLLRLVTVLDSEVDASFAEFLGGAFKKALASTDDKRSLGYQVNYLATAATVNLKLRLEFLESMMASGEKSSNFLAGKAVLLEKLGKTEDALAVVRQILENYSGKSGQDPYASSAFYQVCRAFKDEHAKELRKIFDEIEKAQGESLESTKKRLTMLAQLGLEEEMQGALERAIRKHPDDVGLRERLASTLSSRGWLARSLEARKEALALKPEDENLRERLVMGWRQARHPLNALAVRHEGEKHRKKPADRPAAEATVKKKRTPPATLAGVKKALDSGDETGAQTIFRRLWRRYSQLVANNPYARYYRPNIYRMVWPEDVKEEANKNKKKKQKRSRGGLLEMFSRELTLEEQRRARRSRRVPSGDKNKKEEVRTAQDVLAGQEFGRREIRRQLRSLPSSLLGSVGARDIYKALNAALVDESGQDRVLARLLAREQAGLSGKIEYGMIAALLDGASKESLASMEKSLEGLTKNLNPRDQAQLRRIARLHAKSGRTREAATLYRWCTLLGGAMQMGYYYGTHDLLEEVLANLTGEARIRVVEDVLSYSDPGEWGRDPYLRLVLETWMDLLGPEEALTRSKRVLAEVTRLEMLPLRQACKTAALLQARTGHVEEALRCLEIALCKLPPPAQTRYPWYRTQFERPGYISTYEIATLFPKGMKGFANPGPWLAAAQAKILAWAEAKRLNEYHVPQILSVLALRLHELGNTELASASLSRLEQLAGDRAKDLLWVADVARAIGKTELADGLERRLFDEGRLHVERVPELVSRVIDREGPQAGLALAEQATSLTLHPDLLVQLGVVSMRAGQLDRAARWLGVLHEAEDAEVLLARQDKERAEKAKKERGE